MPLLAASSRARRVQMVAWVEPKFPIESRVPVTVSVFNQAVDRNIERFPADFAFQLTREEHETLRSQIVISKTERRGGRQYLPFAFTEHGAVMAA